ncbi:MAG: hypothetical protein LIP77_03550 [Planctomycetes bacterium]|nr:hypothetical protein [Planctomycetota bacterium]
MNIAPLFATLVTERLATIAELSTVYSLDDALDMAEALGVRNYNTWSAHEEERNNVRRNNY